MMKKNYFNLAALTLGAAIVLSSCLKTEELESVKALREAKVESIKASTALTNADVQIKLASVATSRIKNAYDSANNVYNLQVAAANVRWQEANTKIKENAATVDAATTANTIALNAEQLKTNLAIAKLALDVQNAAIADQVEKAKTSLAIARIGLLTQQKLELDEQRKLDIAKLDNKNLLEVEQAKNPAKARMLADYSAYYNGGTLSDLSVIAKGIYTLKGDILALQALNITETTNKANKIKTNTTDIITKREAIRVDSLDIIKQNSLKAIYTDAKNTLNYTAAYNALVVIANNAYADLKAKEQEQKAIKVKVDTAALASHVADSIFTANNTKKTTAETNYKAIITLVVGAGKLYSDMQVEMTRVANDLTDKQGVYNAWKSKYDAAYSALNTAKNTKNAATARKNVADAAVAAAQVNGGTASAAQLTEQTNATTAENTAITTLTTKQSDFDAIQPTYATDETNYIAAKKANDTIVARNGRYVAFLAIYDAAVTAEVGLLATKTAKLDQLKALNDQNSTALNALGKAGSFSATANGSRNTMETLITSQTNASAGIDDAIAAFNKTIAEEEAEIADLKLQIARVGNTDSTYDSNIALNNQKIAVAQGFVTIYEAKAAALKVLIDKL